LETFLGERNNLIQLFKQASTRLQNDNYKVVMKANKVPFGEQATYFNAHTINEVSIVMISDQLKNLVNKNIQRNNTIQTIQDTHISNDAL